MDEHGNWIEPESYSQIIARLKATKPPVFVAPFKLKWYRREVVAVDANGLELVKMTLDGPKKFRSARPLQRWAKYVFWLQANPWVTGKVGSLTSVSIHTDAFVRTNEPRPAVSRRLSKLLARACTLWN